MLSLRRRLLLGAAMSTAVLLSAAGATLYWMMRTSLWAQFDRALSEKTATLAGLVEQEGEWLDFGFTELDMTEFKRGERPGYFQIWMADGTVVKRSPSLADADLPIYANADPLDHDGATDEPVIHSRVLPDGRAGRIATLYFQVRQDDEMTTAATPKRAVLALARDAAPVEEALADLRRALVTAGALATLASVGLLAWFVGVGLRPADRLARTIGGMDERRLSDRMDPASWPAELEPIVHRLNEFLDRLDAAFTREKTLTVNVAHELRTPLAGLRSTLEVTLSRERDGQSYQDALSGCLTICQQTQALVETLLALARLDAGGEGVRRERTDLELLLRDAFKPYQDAAARKGLNVTWDVDPGLTAETDREKLRLVFRNLLENAVHYSDPGGFVTVRGRTLDGSIDVRVTNTGSRVSPSDAPRVFDRFWRGDDARTSDGTHYGLGLSLCKSLVEHVGGRITADAADDGVFSITVTL